MVQISLQSKGQLLAAGGGATLSVDLWQIATGKKLRILTGPSTGRFGASLQPLSFSPDETRLVTADSHSGMLHIWETASGHRQYTLNERAQHATYSADGKRLLTWGPKAVRASTTCTLARSSLRWSVLKTTAP
jgi:WD40 repeat protein